MLAWEIFRETTIETSLEAAATITFECFQRPILLSKLKEVTKGAASNNVVTVFILIFNFSYFACTYLNK